MPTHMKIIIDTIKLSLLLMVLLESIIKVVKVVGSLENVVFVQHLPGLFKGQQQSRSEHLGCVKKDLEEKPLFQMYTLGGGGPKTPVAG